jgi:hypothetical protein
MKRGENEMNQTEQDRLETLAASIGLETSDWSVDHKPGGGAITSFGFCIPTGIIPMREALGRPDMETVNRFVIDVAGRVGACYACTAAEVVEDIYKVAERLPRASLEIRLVTAAQGEAAASLQDSGEYEWLEIMAAHFATLEAN